MPTSSRLPAKVPLSPPLPYRNAPPMYVPDGEARSPPHLHQRRAMSLSTNEPTYRRLPPSTANPVAIINDLTAAAEETQAICDNGRYRVDSLDFDISNAIRYAAAKTVEYLPDEPIDGTGARYATPGTTTRTHVVTFPVMTAARLFEDRNPVILNFASARAPQSVPLGSRQTQEGCIFRCTGLYPAIENRQVYRYYRKGSHDDDGFYSDWLLYSPKIPVIRDDRTNKLVTPWLASVITCPAVNRYIVNAKNPSRLPDVKPALFHRAERILAVAQHHGHTDIILGAWGCGGFGNDPGDIAQIFHRLLSKNFKRVFENVVFAIYATTKDDPNVKAFAKYFAA